MTKKERARELYERAGLTLAEIARQLHISYSTVRSWKYRDSCNGSSWADNFKSRKRCMTQSQLDNLIFYETGNYDSFKHGLFSARLSPEAQELYDTEFRDTDSDPFIRAINFEFCRYVCASKGLDYSRPTGWLAESRQALRLCNMIASYSQLKGIIKELNRLSELEPELEPEQEKRLAQIIKIDLRQKIETASHYFPETEQILLAA